MTTSIIMPAYNAAATLEEAVDSVRAQSSVEWELIIIDDGSTDDIPPIADRLAAADPRIRVVHQVNRGEAGARNAGLALARGAWVAFLDADDWIAPDFLARMTAALRADPTLDAVHCRWARVAADGTEIADGYQPPIGTMFDVWARRSAFPVHACVVRREVVERLGGSIRPRSSPLTGTSGSGWRGPASASARCPRSSPSIG